MSRRIIRCALDGCHRPAYYKSSELCKTCYARLYYQLQRGVSWAFKRSRQLAVWQSGLERVQQGVPVIERGRRRRQRAA